MSGKKSHTAEESNEHYHRLLSQGVTNLSIDVDLPTLTGYDSDHPLAEGEVGRTGSPIDSIEDMQILFKGIRLEDVSTSIMINATGFILLAFYTALAKQQGADLKKITGTIQNDKKEIHIYPPKHSTRIISDMSEWCSQELPKWNILSPSDSPIRKTGIVKEPGATDPDDSLRQVQTDKLVSFRRRRDPARCDSILQYLNDEASSEENIMPVIVEAVEHLCTLGEIADTLREVFGEYK